MQTPADYASGYEKARAVDPELADRYIAHTVIGDPEAEAVAAYLGVLPVQGSVQLMREGMEHPEGSELLERHPLVRDFFLSASVAPDWLDTDALQPAYRMFHRNTRLVLSAMVGGVLVEGFSTNISKPFYITGRLRDSGVRRLRQNNRHMVEIFLPGGLDRQGEGWKLSVRIRLIHARIRNLLKRSDDWDTAAWGRPISAAHLAFALAAFSARLLKHLKALGGVYNDDERASFMSVWRYSGYLMGIPESVLYRDEADALRIFEVGRLCEPPVDFESIVMAHTLANAAAQVVGITDRVERRQLTEYVYKVSRAMIGNELADALKYPPSSTFGVLPLFRLQARYSRIISRIWTGHATHSNFARFTDLFTASQYDEEGIGYHLPNHHYAERSRRY